MWNAKDQMVVDRRQQFLLAPAKPLLSCIGLTLWAVAVTARVKPELLISAVIASVAMATKSRSAATDNGIENFGSVATSMLSNSVAETAVLPCE